MIVCQMEISRFKALCLFCLPDFVPQWIGLGRMHVLIGIAFIALAIAIIGYISVDFLLDQGFEIGLRIIARIGGDHGIGVA